MLPYETKLGLALPLAPPLLGCLLGCSSPQVGQPGQPSSVPKTGAEALAEPVAVCAPGKAANPLVVDWPAHTRASLEAQMQRGLGVVAYSCKQVRVLFDCRIKGDYGFQKFAPKEQRMVFRNDRELGGHLSVGGLALAASVGANWSKSQQLGLNMLMVGERHRKEKSAAVTLPNSRECAGATHWVEAAFVGAFALKMESQSAHGVKVSAFGQGVEEGRSIGAAALRADGNPKACPTAGKDCQALVRLRLRPFGQHAAPAPTKVARQCKGKEQCEAACLNGAAKACRRAAQAIMALPKSKRDGALAALYFQLACDDGAGCHGLGTLHLKGEGVAKDASRAFHLQKRACNAGVIAGCLAAADALSRGRGVQKNIPTASQLLMGRCRKGAQAACHGLGEILLRDAPDAPPEALAALTQACDGKLGAACYRLGLLYEKGKGVPPSEANAAELFTSACKSGEKKGCQALTRLGQPLPAGKKP